MDKLHQSEQELLELAKVISIDETELAKSTGSNFNLFDILGVSNLELKHSAILAELLSPSGSHGQGDLFLKLFLNLCKINAIHAAGATVGTEKYIGPVSSDGTQGGRVDILIKGTTGAKVVIENKVHANEQVNQLLRYRNAYPDATILYLTLDGSEPTSNDKNSPGDELQCLSYGSHIIQWLEACREVVDKVPIIRESITQYINTLKTLTHQNTNDIMSSKITEAALKNEESLNAFFAIANSRETLLQSITQKLKRDLKEWGKEYNLYLTGFDDNLGNSKAEIFFSSPEWPKGLRVGFQFEKISYQDMFFGVLNCDTLTDDLRCKMLSKSQEYGREYKQSAHWVIWDNSNVHRKWDEDTWHAIQFGKFVKDIEQQIIDLKSI